MVDDNAVNRRILTELLCQWNMRPAAAASGTEALAMMRQAGELGDPFTLVVTDFHMPEMDGFELVRRIRNSHDLTDAVVMMLTSGARNGDAQRCRELGIPVHVTKPVRRAELRLALAKVVASHKPNLGSPAGLAAPAPVAPRTGLRILLAEDNVVNQRVAVRTLEKQGHAVLVANNGVEALDALGRGHFDVVLMDVQMPEMGGFEATAKIRESGSRIPIIAMTAHAMAGDRERCLTAGMDDYISKPIRAAALLELVEKYRPQPVA